MKSEREKTNITYNAYMWNLEKWYRWAYCKSGIETQSERMNAWAQWEGQGGISWEIRIDIYTLPCVKYIASGKLL